MKGQRIIVVVHLKVAVILADRFLYTFDAEPMLTLILFFGGQGSLRAGERIFPAGVYDCNYGKRRFGASGGIDFDKCFGDAGGGFYRIVQQVAKQGGNVAVGDKVEDAVTYIDMEGDLHAAALTLVAAQNSVKQFVVA